MEWLRRLVGKSANQRPSAKAELPPLRDIDPAAAPSQGFARPHFRFFPACYEFAENGEPIFLRRVGPCHCCGQRDVLAFKGSIYWIRRDTPVICAQCIADGRLDRLLPEGVRYGLHDCEVEEIDWRDALVDEVKRRTPGFATFNAFTWPVLDGVPMAFMGYGDDERWESIPEAIAAMIEAEEGENPYPSPYLLIFRQVDGTRYRAVFDPD
ncbi:MAG: CbrC family protein [Erythrobacter sp.]|nr:CbrC family protein [Erythrobacter sp.]